MSPTTFAPARQTALFVLTALAAATAHAEPAVIYDMGGKFDKSFNEAAYAGAERWKKESGKTYLDFEVANATQRDQAVRRMAERGATPVVGIGFAQGASVEKAAKEFPKLQFRSSTSSSTCPTCSRWCSRNKRAVSWSA